MRAGRVAGAIERTAPRSVERKLQSHGSIYWCSGSPDRAARISATLASRPKFERGPGRPSLAVAHLIRERDSAFPQSNVKASLPPHNSLGSRGFSKGLSRHGSCSVPGEGLGSPGRGRRPGDDCDPGEPGSRPPRLARQIA